MNWTRRQPVPPVISLVLMTAALVLFTGSVQAMTRSSTRIENQAMATYSWEQQLLTTWSNRVTVTVGQVAGVEVSPTSEGVPGRPGLSPAHHQQALAVQVVNIPYQVINTGNGPDTYRLSVKQEADGPGLPPPLVELGICHDRGHDGFVDPLDREIQEIVLDAGESASLIVSFRVPLAAVEGTTYFTALQATSTADPSVEAANTWSATQVCTSQPVLVIRRSLEVTPRPTKAPTQGGGGYVAGQSAVLTHTITIDNLGYSPATDVLFHDRIDPSEHLLGDSYGLGMGLLVSGTPRSLDTTTNPQARVAMDDDYQAIEITLPRIESTQRVVIEYKVKLDWRAEQDHIRKAAQLLHTSPNGEPLTHSSNELLTRKEGGNAVRIIPRGATAVPGEPDLQVQPLATPGQRLAFPMTIQNTGTLAGVVELHSIAAPPGWTLEFFAADGITPLLDSNHNTLVDLELLELGDYRDIVVVVTVPADSAQYVSPPYLLEIEAFFSEAPEQTARTRMRIDAVKPVTELWDPLLLTTDVPGAIVRESLITYTFLFGNASGVDAHDVVITEELSPYLSPPTTWSGQVGPGVSGVYDALTHSMIWTIPVVPAGDGGKLVFQSYVREDAPEEALIQLQAKLVSSLHAVPLVSNVVKSIVVGDALMIHLWAARPVVSVGDVNTYYVDVTNLSTKAALEGVDVVVTLPPGLMYQPSSLRENGVRKVEPLVSAGTLHHRIDRLEKASTTHLTFAATVTTAADSELIVRAEASMPIEGKPALTTPPAEVRTLVHAGVFSSSGLIVGQLLTEDGVPVPGVQVILDNGRYAVSDQKGRFTFTSVRPGVRIVRLDPATLKEAHVGEPETTRLRLIVPTGGIAMADFVIQPAVIEVVTVENVLEGEGM